MPFVRLEIEWRTALPRLCVSTSSPAAGGVPSMRPAIAGTELHRILRAVPAYPATLYPGRHPFLLPASPGLSDPQLQVSPSAHCRPAAGPNAGNLRPEERRV